MSYEKTVIEKADALIKAVRAAQNDECYSLNAGLHDEAIFAAVDALQKALEEKP